MNPVEESSPGVVALLLDDLAPPRLGTLLRGARKQRSLSRRDVAGQVGTTPGDLRRYERGDAPVPPAIVAALAACYGEDLTAQFATRVPIQVDRRRVVVGTEDAAPASEDDDAVLSAYVGIVARLRQAKPGEPIALRTDDLVALSTALGHDPEHVEARIVELLGCTPREARSLHSELLRRKLVLPVAGLVAGLAVVTGVGVAAAAPGSHATPAHHDAAPAAAVVAHAIADPPTTVAAKPDPPTTVAPPVTSPAVVPVPAPPTTAAPVTTEAPTTTPPAPPTTEAPAAPAVAPPKITTDNTPMGIPANETVTIIQP